MAARAVGPYGSLHRPAADDLHGGLARLGSRAPCVHHLYILLRLPRMRGKIPSAAFAASVVAGVKIRIVHRVQGTSGAAAATRCAQGHVHHVLHQTMRHTRAECSLVLCRPHRPPVPELVPGLGPVEERRVLRSLPVGLTLRGNERGEISADGSVLPELREISNGPKMHELHAPGRVCCAGGSAAVCGTFYFTSRGFPVRALKDRRLKRNLVSRVSCLVRL